MIEKSGRVILIADGPSKDKILGRESEIDPEVDTVALVNRARWYWKGPADFWITCEASFFFNPNSTWRMAHKDDATKMVSHPSNYFGLHEVWRDKKYGQGTSSLLATEYLLDYQMASNLHMYGVDLCDQVPGSTRTQYSRRRGQWRALLAEHRGKIVDHSYTKWIKRHNFCREACV